jgi:hypothetical protein
MLYMIKITAIAIWVISVFAICNSICTDMKRELAMIRAARALTSAIYDGILSGRTLISVLKNEGAEPLKLLGLYEVYFARGDTALTEQAERFKKIHTALDNNDSTVLTEYLAAYGTLTSARQTEEARRAYTHFDTRYTEKAVACEKNVKVVRTVSATAAFALTVLLL